MVTKLRSHIKHNEHIRDLARQAAKKYYNHIMKNGNSKGYTQKDACKEFGIGKNVLIEEYTQLRRYDSI